MIYAVAKYEKGIYIEQSDDDGKNVVVSCGPFHDEKDAVVAAGMLNLRAERFPEKAVQPSALFCLEPAGNKVLGS